MSLGQVIVTSFCTICVTGAFMTAVLAVAWKVTSRKK